MPKAILELEMPESCRECMFKECLNRTTSVEVSRCIILHKMHVPGSYCPAEGRQADCPLKLVEGKENGCEYCIGENPPTLFENGETIIYYHPGHGRFFDGTYELNWKVYPMCGRRLEVEP